MNDDIKLLKLNDAGRIVAAQATKDGDGVRIRRIAGQQLNVLLDPFLLIDEINSDDSADYIGGFPAHPHRGFQTITYMLEGGFRHRDSLGNEGVISSGGVQWMSAARGVIHSEMPEQENGRLHGFQIWLNLPAREKMRAPEYRDIQGADIPFFEFANGMRIRALAGQMLIDKQMVRGALQLPESQVVLLDVKLPAAGRLRLPVSAEMQTQIYLIAGKLDGLESGHLAHFGSGAAKVIELVAGIDGANFMVLAGLPLKERIAQYGPFVMNSMEEINQALEDYRSGNLASF